MPVRVNGKPDPVLTTNVLTQLTDASGVVHDFPATADGRPKITTPALLKEFLDCGGDMYARPLAPGESANDQYVPRNPAAEMVAQLAQVKLRESETGGADAELKRDLHRARVISDQLPAASPAQEAASLPRTYGEYYERQRAAAALADDLGYDLREMPTVPKLPMATMREVPSPLMTALGLFPKGMGTVQYSGGLLAIEKRLALDLKTRDARRERERAWAEYETRQAAERAEAMVGTPDARLRALELKLAGQAAPGEPHVPLPDVINYGRENVQEAPPGAHVTVTGTGDDLVRDELPPPTSMGVINYGVDAS